MRRLLPMVVAISAGVITMTGLVDTIVPQVVAAFLIQIVVVTAALALVLGLFNLFGVHGNRILKTESGWFYSLVTLFSMLIVLGIHAAGINTDDDVPVSSVIFERLQVSLESALAGLLFFFLVYAAYRLMRDRPTVNGCWFTSAILIVLLGWIPLQSLDALSSLRDWFLEVPVTAGAQGLLLGVALGTVTVGVRVLIGQEQAYRED